MGVKIDGKAKKTLLGYLITSIESIEDSCQRVIDKYKSATTVEDIVAAKRDFVIDVIKELPHGSLHCYFCTTMNMDCKNCGYAKVHLPCGSDKSTYNKVSDARSAFIHAMQEFHEDGQKYD